MRDIDQAMKMGAGMPMGPFELADLVGIDVLYHVEESIKQMEGSFLSPRPTQIVKKMFYSGRYGKKEWKRLLQLFVDLSVFFVNDGISESEMQILLLHRFRKRYRLNSGDTNQY